MKLPDKHLEGLLKCYNEEMLPIAKTIKFISALMICSASLLCGTKPLEADAATAKTPAYIVKPASLLGLNKVIDSPHFSIYFHASDEKKARQLIAISEKDYAALTKIFPVTPKTKILITFNANEYINVFNAAPPSSKKAYEKPGASGGAFCVGCAQSLGNNTEYVYMLRP